jgi:hypothetical protein
MTDEDIMNRVALLFEKIAGKEFEVRTKGRSDEKYYPAYSVEASGESARKIMRTIVRHMGYRRRRRIWQALNGYKEKKPTAKINIAKIIHLSQKANS